MEKRAISIPEMAQSLGIGRNAAYDLAHREGFPALRVGHRVVVPIAALDKWLDAHAGEVTK